MSLPYQFKKLNLNGLNQLVDLARDEGWNPGPHDAEVFFNADPEGYYGYFNGEDMLGGGSIVSYGGAFGFMGLFIMKPEYRGKGLGRELWHLRRDTLLSRLKPAAAIGMDGVVNMQPFYAKGGFKIAFRDERYLRKGSRFKINPSINTLQEKHYRDVLKMDEYCFGYKRDLFIIPWLTTPDSESFVSIENDQLNGFAHIRKVYKGFKIGPLFAHDSKSAENLYRACLNFAKDEDVYIDIPVSNENAINIVKNYGADCVYECARMYYGDPPKLPVENIYGISSFELG